MKKIIFMVIILCLSASFGMAQAPKGVPLAKESAEKPVASQPEVAVLSGHIIDNMCAGAQKQEALAEFVKTHTKECATAPACAASGYSLVVDGAANKLDKDSVIKVEEFLKNPESKLAVTVEAKKVGEELSIVSIKNQE